MYLFFQENSSFITPTVIYILSLVFALLIHNKHTIIKKTRHQAFHRTNTTWREGRWTGGGNHVLSRVYRVFLTGDRQTRCLGGDRPTTVWCLQEHQLCYLRHRRTKFSLTVSWKRPDKLGCRSNSPSCCAALTTSHVEKENIKCPKGILSSGRPLHVKVGDGGWMEKLAPGLGRVSGESWPIPRAHVGLRLVWETLGRCFPHDDMRVLDACSWRRKHVVAYSSRDTNLLWGPHSWFVDGGCSGNLYLGQDIGDEEVLIGRHFWVGRGCFSWGGGGGRESARARSTGSVAGRLVISNNPIGQTRALFQVSTKRRPIPRTEDGEGAVTPRSTTDSTEQWVWCLCRYGLCCYLLYVCYMYMSVICCWNVDLYHELKTVKGLLSLVPPRTPRSSGYDVYADVVYVVICYMSVICICLLYVVICYMSVICYISVICLVLGPSCYMYMSVFLWFSIVWNTKSRPTFWHYFSSSVWPQIFNNDNCRYWKFYCQNRPKTKIKTPVVLRTQLYTRRVDFHRWDHRDRTGATGTGPVISDPPQNPGPGWSPMYPVPKNPGPGWSPMCPTGRPGPGTSMSLNAVFP